MKVIVVVFVTSLTVIFFSCEKSIEEKRSDVRKNELENAAHLKEIKADSLKRKSEALNNQAKQLQEKADKLKDSAKKK